MSDETSKTAQWGCNEWKANLFPSPTEKIDLPTIFERFYGLSHEEERNRPGEGILEFWSHDPVAARGLVQTPGKLEFYIRPREVHERPEVIRDMGIVVFPQNSELPEQFAAQTSDFVGSGFLLRRIGVSAQYSLNAGSYEEARLFLLSQLISVASIDPETSDFQFRINRPRPFVDGASAVTINRLCQWLTQAITFEIMEPRGEDAKIINKVLALMIPDVNTDPVVDATSFSVESLKKLTKTLFEFAGEFAINGEKP